MMNKLEQNNTKPLIKASQLSKKFENFTAVDSIGFEIYPGECFGFLGPNGAGKSSTMRMIYCFSEPSSGSLKVLKGETRQYPRQIKAQLGVVPQEDNLDPDLSVRQNLLLYATYFDISKNEAKKRTNELLEFFELEEKQHAKIQTLSGGMRRRLLIARALINQPKILILDEPTTGLDPQARHNIWTRLRQLIAQGVTMVLTTHYMEEAELLCDRLIIMDHGKILARGRPKDLIREHVGHEVLEMRGTKDLLEKYQKKFLELQKKLLHNGSEIETEIMGDTLFVKLKGKKINLMQEYPEIQETAFQLRPADLEDVFLHLTGRDLRD